ncbi:MAG: oligosaccharide flippase family protein [Acidobacteriota bacterium]|nr:MAG: oligosaccharide flippase family protein [Acidobacteriota bacterium]
MTEGTSQTGRSVVRSILYGFSTWLFPLVLSFIATPIIVGALGNEDYGIYVLVLGFIGYSFNLNFVRAVTKEIAGSRGSGDGKRMGEVISASLMLNVPMGLLGMGVLLLAANWLVHDVLLIVPADRDKTVLAFYIASGILFLTMLNQFVNAILQGLHRFDLFSRLFNLNTGLLLSGNAALAWMGYGLNALLFWNLGVLGAMVILGGFICRSLLPPLDLNFSISNPALKKIAGFSAGIIGYQVLSNGLLLFERGWLMRMLGPEDVTFYVVPLTLAIYIHGFIASLMLVMFPLTSELADDRARLERLYAKATRMTVFLVFFILSSVLVIGREFLAAWLGESFADESSILLSIHAVTFSIVAIQVVSWQMMEGLGRTTYNFAVFCVCLVIGLSLMIALTEPYEGTGVAVARLAGFGTIFVSVFVAERLVFGSVKAVFWIKTVSALAVAGAAAAASEFAVLSLVPAGWTAIIAAGLAGFAVYVAVSLVTGGVSKDERAFVREMFAR